MDETSLFAESYDRVFEVPGGQIGVIADLHVIGDLLELQELTIYPIGAERLAVGTSVILLIYREIEFLAREAGFRRLRITGGRLTGANPGRQVILNRSLS